MAREPRRENVRRPEAVDRVKASADKFRKENPDFSDPIPAHLLTASASGLDPHLSTVAAQAEVPRIAGASDADPRLIAQLFTQLTDDRVCGFLGEPRVNVLRLNLALDERYPIRR
jgi:K+-transporting ATPase ATPase C chain